MTDDVRPPSEVEAAIAEAARQARIAALIAQIKEGGARTLEAERLRRQALWTKRPGGPEKGQTT